MTLERSRPQRGEGRAATNDDARSVTGATMEAVAHPDTLRSAMARVMRNRGAAGADGMAVDQLPAWLAANEAWLREHLLAGTYAPSPVRRVTIPKPSGGERVLGIPTAVDRLVQQAVLEVLGPRFDPTFSAHSYGFRPGRSAHDAIRAAQRYVQEGRVVVVDVDLERFFDRVNHDVRMSRLAKRIEDRRLLRVLRAFLSAGHLAPTGVVVTDEEGTPQGGPLSPLLANVLLDEVDRELERSGHAFVRYADDCNVYVRSHAAGERVMRRMVKLFGALRLRVNPSKSAVAYVWERKLLGYTLTVIRGEARLRLAPSTVARFKARVRELTRPTRGRSAAQATAEVGDYLRGWWQYFGLTNAPSAVRDLEGWVLRRLRALELRQWRRGPTAYRSLRAEGLPAKLSAQCAAYVHRPWRGSNLAMKIARPRAWFTARGLPRLVP